MNGRPGRLDYKVIDVFHFILIFLVPAPFDLSDSCAGIIELFLYMLLGLGQQFTGFAIERKEFAIMVFNIKNQLIPERTSKSRNLPKYPVVGHRGRHVLSAAGDV